MRVVPSADHTRVFAFLTNGRAQHPRRSTSGLFITRCVSDHVLRMCPVFTFSPGSDPVRVGLGDSADPAQPPVQVFPNRGLAPSADLRQIFRRTPHQFAQRGDMRIAVGRKATAGATAWVAGATARVGGPR
jgi:hypothetical protein